MLGCACVCVCVCVCGLCKLLRFFEIVIQLFLCPFCVSIQNLDKNIIQVSDHVRTCSGNIFTFPYDAITDIIFLAGIHVLQSP